MSALLGDDNGQPTGRAVRCRHRAGEASADARGLPRPALCAGELLASWMPNNGLPVCAIRERVNRYTVNFGNMLTLPVTYGKMFLDRKAAVGVWPAAEVKNEARLGEGK